MQTRSQRDALAILEQVKAIKQEKKEVIKRYSVLVNDLPMMIRQNGLQQAFGFIQGKSKESMHPITDQKPHSAETYFLNHLADRLGITDDLIQQLYDAPLSEYMYYTRRCLEVSVWYKRYSASLLSDDDTPATKEVKNAS